MLTPCSICRSFGHATADHGSPRGYRRAELLAEISDRATELARDESPEYSEALTARVALGEAGRASERDPQTGGVSVWRTSSMLRRCALDCAAWALLALEATEPPR